jgi:UDP-glucose 4-epimerase
MRVAVTGSENHFGRRLLELLAADAQVESVLAVDVKPPQKTAAKVRWEEVDLVHPRSAERLTTFLRETGAEVLVHTASLSRPSHRGGWAHELEAIGTRNMLAAAEGAGLRKVVLRSTTLAYGARASNPAYLSESAPLAGAEHSTWLADKIEVEHQWAAFAHKHPSRVVTVLRYAPVLGPTADTLGTNFLRGAVAPAWLGFDPLVQVVHEDDAAEAARRALHADVRGAVNIAAPGVLPMSTAVRLAGGHPVPMPGTMLRGVARTLWNTQLGAYPPGMIDFLRYPCVGRLDLMQQALGFTPRHGVREAVASFARSLKLAQAA